MIQTVVRVINVNVFAYLAYLAWTCPCSFIFECHLAQYWGLMIGITALNILNIGVCVALSY
jgi:hypothetical protein